AQVNDNANGSDFDMARSRRATVARVRRECTMHRAASVDVFVDDGVVASVLAVATIDVDESGWACHDRAMKNGHHVVVTPELLAKLPKTDLHCHLDGSMRLHTI